MSLLAEAPHRTHNTVMDRVRSLAPVLLILALPPVMLYPLWSNPVSAGEDDVIFYYPLRKMVAQAIREGRWPVENPHEATGIPLMGDPQSAVMHPPTWLFAAMDSKPAYSLSIFLAFSVAGAGAYLYLRRLGLVRPAAMFGCVAFMFCGFMVGHRVHLSLLQTAVFLPWGLWCLETLRSRPRAAFAFLVPVMYLAITAGHWPTLIQMGVVWLAYFPLRCRPLLRSVAVAAGAIVLAVGLAGPQVLATMGVLAQATRQKIGYAVVGENSFLPTSGLLALFPMLMGSRTPNFYPQKWWGSWHLCEMLGYVGLLTLVLSGGAIWRMYRKDLPSIPTERGPWAFGEKDGQPLGPLVRVWTWIAIGAGIWMLGYYLPTYRLVYMLPVLGVVRCPARMVVAVDMALATLAAIAIHAVLAGKGRSQERVANPAAEGAQGALPIASPECSAAVDRLSQAIRRGTVVVPIVMVAVLVGLAAVAGGLVAMGIWTSGGGLFAGSAWDALRAVVPTNPAVWVPLCLALVTFGAIRFWLKSPRPRAGVLVVLLLVDLFFITRFVDSPAADAFWPDPQLSAAARWLEGNAPKDRPFRVWGLGRHYHDRPDELLLPKTCAGLGLSAINSYGPLQSRAHAHLFGFRIFGTSGEWPALIRRNYLLSLYNVRYILASDRDFRDVIESVRIPASQPAPDGTSVLSETWTLDRAEVSEGVVRLRSPWLPGSSSAQQPVSLRPGTIYRISLDGRGPEGGAGNYLRADVFQKFEDYRWRSDEAWGLTVHAEQIGPAWRHFEWTFQSPGADFDHTYFRLVTPSERPIEVRNVSLRESHLDVPVNLGGRLRPGDAVYAKVAELPPRNPSDPNVVIYENLLCTPARIDGDRAWREEEIEKLKWSAPELSANLAVPGVGLRASFDPAWVWEFTLPAGGLYLLAGAIMILRKPPAKR